MVSKEAQEKIGRLQLLEQNLQQFAAQKQQFQAQLFEYESALKELGDAPDAFKIVGNIMVKSDKAVIQKDIEQKKEIVDLRIKSIEKQESQIKEKAEALRTEVMESMKGETQ